MRHCRPLILGSGLKHYLFQPQFCVGISEKGNLAGEANTFSTSNRSRNGDILKASGAVLSEYMFALWCFNITLRRVTSHPFQKPPLMPLFCLFNACNMQPSGLALYPVHAQKVRRWVYIVHIGPSPRNRDSSPPFVG